MSKVWTPLSRVYPCYLKEDLGQTSGLDPYTLLRQHLHPGSLLFMAGRKTVSSKTEEMPYYSHSPEWLQRLGGRAAYMTHGGICTTYHFAPSLAMPLQISGMVGVSSSGELRSGKCIFWQFFLLGSWWAVPPQALNLSCYCLRYGHTGCCNLQVATWTRILQPLTEAISKTLHMYELVDTLVLV